MSTEARARSHTRTHLRFAALAQRTTAAAERAILIAILNERMNGQLRAVSACIDERRHVLDLQAQLRDACARLKRVGQCEVISSDDGTEERYCVCGAAEGQDDHDDWCPLNGWACPKEGE